MYFSSKSSQKRNSLENFVMSRSKLNMLKRKLEIEYYKNFSETLFHFFSFMSRTPESQKPKIFYYLTVDSKEANVRASSLKI